MEDEISGEPHGAFSPKTRLLWNGKCLLSDAAQRSTRSERRVLFVPAQRAMAMASGWPRPFSSFEHGAPYLIRQFSQNLLEQLEHDVSQGGAAFFPQPDSLNALVRQYIEKSIFHGGQLLLNAANGQKRLVIRYPGSDKQDDSWTELTFLQWSAGQQTFSSLLLSLYQLPPTKNISIDSHEWVVIEEPELGLHPFGIHSVMLLVCELMHRGYKVCISTHSAYVLQLVWAIKTLQKSESPRRFKALLDVLASGSVTLEPLAESLLKSRINAYALTYEQSEYRCTDISDFDIESTDPIIASWGGVTAPSTTVSRAVAQGL